MSKKVKQLISILAISVLSVGAMTGCDNYDYSTVKEIKVSTDKKSDVIQVNFKDESSQISIKTKNKTFSDKLKKIDTTDNSKYQKMVNEGYLEADFKDVKLDKDENKIDVIFEDKEYPIKINSDTIKDGVVEIDAQTKKLNFSNGGFDAMKYKITDFK